MQSEERETNLGVHGLNEVAGRGLGTSGTATWDEQHVDGFIRSNDFVMRGRHDDRLPESPA